MSNSKINVLDDVRRRTLAEIVQERIKPGDYDTVTSLQQELVEHNVVRLYELNTDPVLTRQNHIRFLKKSLTDLSETYECLDSSRPWLCYWILHSLEMLGERLVDDVYSQIVQFLGKCQSPDGGFGGGPGQHSHLASTYAAINALCTIGTPEAYQLIDRNGLKQFLLSLRGEGGSFSLHTDGEADIRGVYCALAVARLANVYTPEIFKETDIWIAKCQTWEGGFGGSPGMEAHGGYTFCGIAALVLLGKTDLCCLKSLLRWVVNKQMPLEGGFQGRTNKLVDGCYSFWQGGVFPLINAILTKEEKVFNSEYWLFNQVALQEYILLCCQDYEGGLVDKPAKCRDIYHTCYVLSGLSIAQNSPRPLIIGPPDLNLLKKLDPVFNLVLSSAADALKHFSTLPIPD